MSDITSIVIIGSIVSLLGTMIGASLGVVVRKPSSRFLGTIIGFAGGLMLAVVVFDLIPEALTKWNFTGTLFCCILGIILIVIIDNFFSFGTSNSHQKVAYLAALGLMLHNFPEGIIMGCGFAAGGSLGIKMSIIIAIHDIPEGIAVAAPLMAVNTKVSKILWFAFITAFPTAIGALAGVFIANISTQILGISLSIASGIMLYVVCGEMIPESSKLWEGIMSTIGILSGIILGMIMINAF